MKVILNTTVPKVGKEGQVVNVANGFARNFLFPKGMARIADKAGIARLERDQQKVLATAEQTKGAAQKIGEKLSGATVRIAGQTAKGSIKLFGAVTSTDIAEAIKTSLKVDVDKRSIALMHPIKRLGVYQVLVDLHRDVDATIKVEVADEHGNLGIEVADTTKAAPVADEPAVEEAPAEAEAPADAPTEAPAEA